MELTSVNNEKVKSWCKLKEKKYRDQERSFLIEDEHLVTEALKLGLVKEMIVLDKNLTFAVPTYYVNSKILKTLSNQVTGAKIMAVCQMIPERKVKGNIIVLDRLQDPGNLGTIIRSAVAFNFDSLILSDDSVDVYNPKVIRASEGMFFHLNIIRTNIFDFLSNLDSSYQKIATDVVNGQNIKDIKFHKSAIVIGNEGGGISEEIKKLCDEKVYINMNNKCESLNAGVAASILMYEVNNG